MGEKLYDELSKYAQGFAPDVKIRMELRISFFFISNSGILQYKGKFIPLTSILRDYGKKRAR